MCVCSNNNHLLVELEGGLISLDGDRHRVLRHRGAERVLVHLYIYIYIYIIYTYMCVCSNNIHLLVELEGGLVSLDGDRHRVLRHGGAERILVSLRHVLVRGQRHRASARLLAAAGRARARGVGVLRFCAESVALGDPLEGVVHKPTLAKREGGLGVERCIRT